MIVLTKTSKNPRLESLESFNHVRTDHFEAYVRATLLPREEYNLFFRNSAVNKNRFSPAREPEYKYVSKTGIEFFVETRFRTRFQDQILEWGKFFELKQYQDVDQVTPVIIAIGLGGQPAAPERVFMVPVRHVKFVKNYPSLLQKYEVEPGQCVSEQFLMRILE